MAHHKRRRPKHQRAGCLLCKPHKDERGSNGKDERAWAGNRRRQEAADAQLKEHDRLARERHQNPGRKAALEASGRAYRG